MCRPDLDKCLGIKNTPIRLETSCPERPKVGFGEGALSSLPPSLPGGPWSSQALFPCSTVQGHPLWAWVASPANDMAASMLDYEIFKLFSCRGYRVPPASPPALLLLCALQRVKRAWWNAALSRSKKAARRDSKKNLRQHSVLDWSPTSILSGPCDACLRGSDETRKVHRGMAADESRGRALR